MAAAESGRRDLVDQFINITGVDNDRAKFYLESSAWDLQIALASFYEDDGEFEVQEIASVNRETTSDELQIIDQPQQQPPPPQSSNKQQSKFATIFGMSENQESDEEEGQAFYAGGSERSGQQILGPKKPKADVVGDIFKAAKDLGAEVVGQEEQENVTTKASSSSFHGAGHRLGANEDDDIEVLSATRSSTRNSQTAKEKKDVTLKMWKDGFSIDDGINQRKYDDPSNREFLESIRRGEIPMELIREARGGEVNLTMEDHRNEMFDQPKSTLKAFSGKGHMLGSPVPPCWTQSNFIPMPQDSQTSENAASQNIKVDESQPTTTLQIRLADGSRLVAKLNHTHTIGDIRQYITIARPQYEATEFVLMTTFPNRELQDDRKTLGDENLLNAVVMQKMV